MATILFYTQTLRPLKSMNGVYLWAIINVQSQLIVEKGPFEYIFLLVVAIWVHFLSFIVHFSCYISHENLTRIHTTKGRCIARECDREQKKEKKGTKKTSSDLIVARSSIVLFWFPLCLRSTVIVFVVILRCRDTFNIRSSVCICQSNGSFTCALHNRIDLINDKCWICETISSECDSVHQFHSIDTVVQLFSCLGDGKQYFLFALTLSFQQQQQYKTDRKPNNHLHRGSILNYISVI